MATKLTLKADKRKLTGRKVKSLRKQGILPVNLFGKGLKSQSLQVKTSDFISIFKQAGETNIVYVQTGTKEEHPVLISNTHHHPVTSSYLHADLYQVDLTKKVTVNVPVNLVGESPIVKDGAVLVQTLRELEVEALPTNIPESIDFDLSGLTKVGDSLKISDAKDNKGANIIPDKETVVVQIQAQKEEEVIEAPAEEPAKGEEVEDKLEGEEKTTEKDDSSKSEDK